jgi:hypothetical protein
MGDYHIFFTMKIAIFGYLPPLDPLGVDIQPHQRLAKESSC